MATIFFNHCDARRPLQPFKRPRHPRSSIIKTTKKLKVTKHLDLDPILDSTNAQTYSVSSPFSLPPFESLGPMPLPENTPPYCLYPPNTPQTPSTTIPTPTTYTPSPISYLPPALPILGPPPSPTGTIPGPPTTNPPTIVLSPPTTNPPTILPSPPTTNPPIIVPSPPSSLPGTPEVVPSPTSYVPSPPEPILTPPYIEPSPPSYVPSPPSYFPSPPVFVPSPVFEPPVVYPPPTVPPPQNSAPDRALWCVAKPSVPDPIIQEAMDYACWSGADCDSIEPTGSCYEPNTLFAHASYAFNSYWQKTRVAGGTCEFGGSAILVTVDPSYDGCHFEFY
ncbi:extensin isoform X2 [Fagus crenata]